MIKCIEPKENKSESFLPLKPIYSKVSLVVIFPTEEPWDEESLINFFRDMKALGVSQPPSISL